MRPPVPPHSPDDLSAEIEATIARCQGAVRGVARGHGLDEADVDAVFQEVRIRIWRSLRTGDRITEASASYVYRAATSAALDLIKSRRRESRETRVDDPALGLADQSDPGKELERSEVSTRVHEAVAALSDTRRPVVRMHLTGYKLPEIARLLGWSEPKVRNLLYRGLDDLRSHLRASGVRVGAIE